jgi:cell division protein FtsB
MGKNMLRSDTRLLSRREKRVQVAALGWLLFLGGMALAGPSGVLAWGENLSLLDKREVQIKELQAERNELRNRVALLDPAHVDPDLAGELVRKNLNVVHPDEVVITLK